MFFQQFKVTGLGCLSYMIGCPRNGQVVVVDPKRDIKDYLTTAKQNKMKISHILETHVHADHISGAMDLQQATGAPVYIGVDSPVIYDHQPLHDGETFTIGSLKIQVIATPGHTPHSISLAIADLSRSALPQILLTGDLLFVGSIGRPDLAGSEMLEEQINNLYNSLFTKLNRFGDYVEVYPAHGEGSLCGAGLSAKPSTTLGYERHTNPYLKLSREDFKKNLQENQPHRPQNFAYIIDNNREGAVIEEKLPVPRPKNAAAVATYLDNPEQYTMVDLREAAAFGGAHIPGSINIGPSPNSATWLGNVINPEKNIILLADSLEQVYRAITTFRRVGYNQIIGYCLGLSDWILSGRKTGFLPQISVHSLQNVLAKYDNHTVIDVRTPNEWQSGHIDRAIHLPLPQLLAQGIELDLTSHISVICGSGYRSNIAGSILKAKGYTNIYSVTGGMLAWKMAGFGTV